VFEEFGGIPMHPLLVHAAVIFVPLLALLAIAYGFLPFVRRHVRWVLAGLAVVAPGAALFSKLSGDAAFARGQEKGWISEGFVGVIEEHQAYGANTALWSYFLAALTLVLVYAVTPRAVAGAAATVSGPRWRNNRVLGLILAVLVTVVGAVAMYYVFKTGDSGAKAVWIDR
jgi:hypothetical protein